MDVQKLHLQKKRRSGLSTHSTLQIFNNSTCLPSCHHLSKDSGLTPRAPHKDTMKSSCFCFGAFTAQELVLVELALGVEVVGLRVAVLDLALMPVKTFVSEPVVALALVPA